VVAEDASTIPHSGAAQVAVVDSAKVPTIRVAAPAAKATTAGRATTDATATSAVPVVEAAALPAPAEPPARTRVELVAADSSSRWTVFNVGTRLAAVVAATVARQVDHPAPEPVADRRPTAATQIPAREAAEVEPAAVTTAPIAVVTEVRAS
jgi:hypothetical protein